MPDETPVAPVPVPPPPAGTSPQPQVVQIQVQPLENGFVVQAVNLDGERLHKRLIATSREDAVVKVKQLADLLYSKVSI